MVRYYSGQNREISWLINFKCPTVSEYFDVISESKEYTICCALKLRFIKLKYRVIETWLLILETQCGYNFLFRLMQTMSDCKEDFSTLTKLLSLFYQFQNDYCNLHQAEVYFTKLQ